MKVLLQRVKSASVTIDEKVNGEIKKGLVVFFCVEKGDTTDKLQWIVDKIINLRIFDESEEKTMRSLLDINGDMLIISQFTLAGDVNKGRRPDFTNAEKPDIANKIYEDFIALVRNNIKGHVATGIFGADMDVSLVNSGPYTILIDK